MKENYCRVTKVPKYHGMKEQSSTISHMSAHQPGLFGWPCSMGFLFSLDKMTHPSKSSIGGSTRGQSETHEDSEGPSSELAHCYFYLILLPKASHVDKPKSWDSGIHSIISVGRTSKS
jgi:hypothetical protein